MAVLYHLALSNASDVLVTATLKFGSTTKFVFNLPADGGTVLMNFYGTEISTGMNEAVTVTLSAAKTVDVTVCYILN